MEAIHDMPTLEVGDVVKIGTDCYYLMLGSTMAYSLYYDDGTISGTVELGDLAYVDPSDVKAVYGNIRSFLSREELRKILAEDDEIKPKWVRREVREMTMEQLAAELGCKLRIVGADGKAV